MSVLTRITTRAKQLYKKGKAGISWRNAIKKASAQLTGKAKGRVKKKTKRFSRGGVGKGPTITPTRKIVIAGIGSPRRKKRIGKTVAKGFSVSGIDKPAFTTLGYLLGELSKAQNQFEILKQKKRDKKLLDPFAKLLFKRYPGYIRSLKKQISEAKKNIR